MALLQGRLGAACHMSCFEEEALLWMEKSMTRASPQDSVLSVERENTPMCEHHAVTIRLPETKAKGSLQMAKPT